MWRSHLRNHDGVIEIEGVVIMTASEYVEYALYRQREQEMNLRNERRRVALERQDVRPASPATGPRPGLAHVVRNRVNALVTRVPARG
jgi:hypothetical protein